eukprot:243614_1
MLHKESITSEKWLECLLVLDDQLRDSIYSTSNDIIVLSAPYRLNKIHTALKKSLISIHDESLLFCIDFIMDFIVLNKRTVSNKLSKSCCCAYSWLLSRNAIIIINTKCGNIFTLPRNHKHLPSSLILDIAFTNNKDYIGVIKKCIKPTLYHLFPSKFRIQVAADWSQRSQFKNTSKIGYLCTDGNFVSAHFIQQIGDRILLQFNISNKKDYVRVAVPNARIAPPPPISLNSTNIAMYTGFCHCEERISLSVCYGNTICHKVAKFVEIMKLYNTSYTSIDKLDINLNLLDIFLHLMDKHDDTKSFEIIRKRLECVCDVSQCNIFNRHHTDRNELKTTNQIHKLYECETEQEQQNLDVKNVAIKQILDKMHCYYQHSYDVGFRLDSEERINIHKISKSNEDQLIKKQKQHMKIREIINTKRVKNNNMSYRSDRFCTKQNKSNNVSVKNKEYSFGFVFDYPYNEDSIEENPKTENKCEDDGYHNSYCLESETLFGTHDEEQWQWERYYIGNITPKYNNLKQEMISNHVDTITIVQFQIEYQKSEIHYNSVHCVNNIRNDPLFWPNNYSTKNTHYYYRRRNLTIQDILSVMLYCNYIIVL